GSHGGRHVYYDRMTAVEAEADIAFIKQVHRDNGLALDSFVFPRNAVGYLDLLAPAGLRTFRGPDTGWVPLAPNRGSRAATIGDNHTSAPAEAGARGKGRRPRRHSGLDAAAGARRRAAIHFPHGQPGETRHGSRLGAAQRADVSLLVPSLQFLLPRRRAIR